MSRTPSGRRLIVLSAVLGALLLSLVPQLPARADDPPPPRRIVSGWLPYWSTSASIASLTSNADLMREVSPFWYTVRWTGSTSQLSANVSSTSKAALKSAAANLGIGLWPTFTDSMPARRLASVMANSTQRHTLVKQLVDLAVAEGYAGLDLDFEKFAFSDGSSTWSTTRPAWVHFVADLAAALHSKGKKLAATTPPLCNLSGVCGPDRGYWVYDWAGIAPSVDILRVMAYDYSWSVPGPIGPFPWTEAIVAYASSVAAPGQVEIGVPTYGRDWARRDSSGHYLVTGTCPSSTPSNYLSKHTFDAVYWPTFLANRGLSKANVQWSTTYRESYVNYSRTYSDSTTSCTVKRQAWVGDARAVATRATLVAKYQIAGIVTWTIGGEDPGQWSRLRSFARGIAPSATTVTMAAPLAYTYRTPIIVRASVLSQGVAVPSAVVRLKWRRAGATTWTVLSSAMTDSAGRVRWTTTPRAAGQFQVVAASDWTRLAGAAKRSVLLRQVLTAGRSGTRIKSAVTPLIHGQRFIVQRRSAGRWRYYAIARVSRAGYPYLSMPVTSSVRYYRFVALSTRNSVRARSRTIRY